MTQALNIVWFKRDLRIEDHAPLAMAARSGQVLPLYIVEPELRPATTMNEDDGFQAQFKGAVMPTECGSLNRKRVITITRAAGMPGQLTAIMIVAAAGSGPTRKPSHLTAVTTVAESYRKSPQ